MRFFALMGVSFGIFSFPQSDWKGEVFVDGEQNYQLVDPSLALQKVGRDPREVIFLVVVLILPRQPKRP